MQRAALVLAVACAAACASAQESAAPTARPQAAAPRPMFAPGAVAGVRRLTPAERQERRFLQDAAAAVRLESDAAKLAATRAASASVRELAAAMATQSDRLQPALLRLLHARGMAPPLSPVQHHRILKELARAKGARFDRAFVDKVALGVHAEALADYEHMAVQAQDAALQAWVAQALPAMRDTLALAQRALPPPRIGGDATHRGPAIGGDAARRGLATAPGSR